MTPSIAEIKARLDAATPGPWKWDFEPGPDDHGVWRDGLSDANGNGVLYHAAMWGIPTDTRVLLANAPADIRKLLDDHDRLEGVVGRLREEMLNSAAAIHSARQDKDDTMGEFPNLWPLYAELESRLFEAALAAAPQTGGDDE